MRINISYKDNFGNECFGFSWPRKIGDNQIGKIRRFALQQRDFHAGTLRREHGFIGKVKLGVKIVNKTLIMELYKFLTAEGIEHSFTSPHSIYKFRFLDFDFEVIEDESETIESFKAKVNKMLIEKLKEQRDFYKNMTNIMQRHLDENVTFF